MHTSGPRFVYALVGLSLVGALGAATAAQPRPAPVPASGLGLGWGWQSERETAVPSICVEFERGEDLAQTARLTIREVSDRSELMDTLNISASAAVDAITWSANASASFAKSVELQQTSSTFLLRAEIDDGLIFTAPPGAGGPLRTVPRPVARATDSGSQSESIGDRLDRLFGWPAAAMAASSAPPAVDTVTSSEPPNAVRLTPRAHALIASGQVAAFLKECGDSFIWGIRGGAELNAAITFNSRSLQEKEQISAEMSGSYSFVRGTGKFAEGHDASEEAENYTLTSVQVGGSRGTIPGSREKLLEKLDDLAREAAERPKPVGIMISSYHALPDWPAGPLAAGQSARDLRLASYWRYTTLYENIEEILNNQAGYMLNRGATVKSLRELQDQVAAIRASIENAARAIDTFERNEGPSAEIASTMEKVSAVRDALKTTLQAPAEPVSGSPRNTFRVATGPAARELALALGDAESAMVPIEDLLTRMPLPYASPTEKAEDELTDTELQKAVVDYYIGRPSKRRCAIAATAPGCLTNREIRGYELQVPTGPKDLTRHGDPEGYGSGERFGDVPLYSVLDSRLKRISIHYNQVGIVGLDLAYKTPDGREVVVGTGQPNGAQTKSMELAEDERLAKVSGIWLPLTARRVDLRHVVELTFTTTSKAKLSHEGLVARQPDVRAAGKAFAFQPKEGEEIFALSGRLHPLALNARRSLPEWTMLGLLEPVYRKAEE